VELHGCKARQPFLRRRVEASFQCRLVLSPLLLPPLHHPRRLQRGRERSKQWWQQRRSRRRRRRHRRCRCRSRSRRSRKTLGRSREERTCVQREYQTAERIPNENTKLRVQALQRNVRERGHDRQNFHCKLQWKSTCMRAGHARVLEKATLTSPGYTSHHEESFCRPCRTPPAEQKEQLAAPAGAASSTGLLDCCCLRCAATTAAAAALQAGADVVARAHQKVLSSPLALLRAFSPIQHDIPAYSMKLAFRS
jgi:hypothetical protein